MIRKFLNIALALLVAALPIETFAQATPQAAYGAATQYLGTKAYRPQMPAAFLSAWGGTYVITPTLTYNADGSVKGDAGFNPKTLAVYTTALAGANFYVDSSTGSDAHGCTNSGADVCLSIKRAQDVLDATAAPGNIWVKCSTLPYDKDKNWSAGVSTNIPDVDSIYHANGGKTCITGTNSVTMTWAADGTYSWIWKSTRSAVQRVVDLKNTNSATGLGTRVNLVGSALLVSVTPNSYYTDGTSLWLNRADGLQPTTSGANANTFVSLTSSNFVTTGTTPHNLFFVTETAADAWEFRGGTGGTGDLTASYTGATGAPAIIYAENAAFNYAGDDTTSGGTVNGNGVVINSLNGLFMCKNCTYGGNKTDGVGVKDDNAQGGCRLLTVNNVGIENGTPGGQSANFWTQHNGCIGISIADSGTLSAGATYGMIGTTKSWIVGSKATKSRGDVIYGYTFQPREISVDDTSTVWADRVFVDPTLTGSCHLLVIASGASIFTRSLIAPHGQLCNGAGGTVDTY